MNYSLIRRVSHLSHSLAAAALTAAPVLVSPSLALAQTVTGGASPQTMLNNVCTFILGPFGQTLAVLGIIAIGVLWMLAVLLWALSPASSAASSSCSARPIWAKP